MPEPHPLGQVEMNPVRYYRIVENRGHVGIMCLRCNMVSYHQRDIDERYCAKCHMYHPLPERQA